MMIKTQTLCPFCDSAIYVMEFNSHYQKRQFIVPNACNFCRASESSIESQLNRKFTSPKVERSYIKVDPRG